MLDLAVIGAGAMGSHHARIARQTKDARVAVIVDPDLAKAEQLAEWAGALAVDNLTEAIDHFDAAIVATPTQTHFALASELIMAGRHVLVEKPIASSLHEAREMAAAAERAGVVLTVGHVERFNPAVLELEHLVSDPIHITARRVSPYMPRVGVGVVLDLMVHDLDIVHHIVGSDVMSIQALTSTVRSDTEDIALALIQFANGSTASLQSSRLGQQKIRELTVTMPESFLTVDLLRQDVTINRVSHSEYLSAEGSRYRQTGVVEIPFLESRGEPLALEQDDFVRAILDGREPYISATEGINALELAEAVLAAANRA